MIQGQVVGIGQPKAASPGLAASHSHGPAEATLPMLRQSHHPAMAPAALALRTTEHSRIGTTLSAGRTRRESDQQVPADRINLGVFRSGRWGGTDGAGGQMRVDQDGSLEGFTLSAIQIGQRSELPGIGRNGGVVTKQLCTGAVAVAVGQLHGAGEICFAETARPKRVNHGIRRQGQPLAGAIGMKAGHLKLTGLQQP